MKILNFDEYNDEVEGEEVIVLDYLKKIIIDLEKYKSFDGSTVKDLELNFGAYEINFVLEYKNSDDVITHINHFNNFCKQFDWCDKESLNTIESDGYDEIMWDALEDENGSTVSAATEFQVMRGDLYITIKLH